MPESPRSRVTLRPEAVAFDEGGPLPAEKTYARDYQVQRLLGEGGMGRVVAARDQVLHRRVAIKELRAEVRGRPDLWGRFLREAQIGGQLEHPNIVPIYAFQFSPDGGPAFVMQLIDGESLADYIERSRARLVSGNPDVPSLKERLSVLLPVCDAIAYAHGRGVLHRDLKPDNVMLGPHNVVLVTDWGIARVESDEAGVEGTAEDPVLTASADFPAETRGEAIGEAPTIATPEMKPVAGSPTTNPKTAVGSVLGTPEYMSPEQALGVAVGRASDQYSLGLMLLELAALRPARSRDGATAAYSQALLNQHAEHVDAGGDPLDHRLSAIISRATQKDPNDRYRDVEALAQDIRAFMRDEELSVLPDSPARKFLRHLQRHPVRSVMTGAILLLALAGWGIVSTSKVAERAEQGRDDAKALSRLSALVLSEGRAIERYLLEVDSSLVGLARTVMVRLNDPRPVVSPLPEVFEPKDFIEGRASGIVVNELDKTIRSYRDPVFVFSPTATKGARDDAIRLAAAKGDLIDIYLSGIDEAAHTLPRPEQEALMASHQQGVVRLVIALENGLFAQFPARADFSPSYDARTMDWYRKSIQARGSSFLRPKYGPLARIPRGAVARPIENKGKVIGVVAAGYWLEPLVELLGARGDQNLVAAFLAAPDGKEIASRELLANATRGEPEGPVPLADLRSTALRSALRADRESGYLIDGRRLFVFTKLSIEDWFLVHEYPLSEHLKVVR